MGAVRVEVLGAVRLVVDGAQIHVGGRREQVLLALLAMSGGSPVSADRLVDEIWGEDPPATAHGSLQVAVSRLRKVLGEHAQVTRGAGGYALTGATTDATDLASAAQTVAGAAPGAVLDLTAATLGAWRGEPFAGLSGSPTLQHERTRLTDDRLRLVEARAEAFLSLGDPEAAVRTLASPAADHPYRERLWSTLALAQYSCERQAEALATLRTLRAALVDDLGVDPSASVRTLEARILAQDPDLSAPVLRAEPEAGVSGRTRLVGREESLADLASALDRVLSGGGLEVVLISGEAGIGKSALATELIARARSAGAIVTLGRCHEADVAPAYWPWLPVLRDLAPLADARPDGVTQLLDGASGPAAGPAGVEAAAAATMRTFAAVSALLSDAPRPLVVLLEDLHWADQTSLRLLAYLAEDLAGRPVLLMGTLRDVDPRRHVGVARAMGDLARLGARRVALGPLPTDAVSELVATVIPDPDEPLVGAVAARADGNPFFVQQLVQLLTERDELTSGAATSLQVPDGVADVLRMRVMLLSDAARHALEVASVAGREFDPSLLAGLQVPLDDLDEPLAQRFLEATGSGGFRFVHALMRETVYADLTITRRVRLHAGLGSVLAGRVDHDPSLATEVAHHLAVAAVYLPDLAGSAVDMGRRAARDAEGRGAFAEARALWSRTVEVERRLPPEPARRHELLLALSTAQERLGEMHGHLATIGEAISMARATGDHWRMAEAATSYRSSGIWHWRELGAEDPAAIVTLQECLDEVDDPRLLARVWASLGLEHYIALRPDEADQCGRRSLELARSGDDPETLRDCLAAREVVVGWRPGPSDEQIACARQSLLLADTSEYEIAARFHLGTALHRTGRTAESDDVLEPAYALAARLRHTGADIPLAWWRWLRAGEREDPDSEAVARSALELHRRSSVVGIDELTALTTLAALAARPGGGRVPEDIVDAATGHPNVGFRAAVAFALCEAGEAPRGADLLGGFAPLGGHYASLYAGALSVAVYAAVQHADLERAVEAIRPHAGEVATYGSVMSLGSTTLWIGEGLAALGRTDEARSAVEEALRVNADAGCVRWERAARERLAELR